MTFSPIKKHNFLSKSADHLKLKKGLSLDFARKYYRSFEIVGVNQNGIDYFIKFDGSNRAKKTFVSPSENEVDWNESDEETFLKIYDKTILKTINMFRKE
ncbi:hypothetical protein BpHYR1_049703 [Brachionus plicatilis]|uniref:Uncharacterized protein n=1 Tax=Brachionus plicatilis TaxID=10195 RepID=A0A3M7QZZ5_BRAPC|nr:hypothetical protein BpHYR1_049703 [Brachionus plicatilis]